MPPLELLFLSRDDVAGLDLAPDDVLAAVEDGLRAHGEGRVVLPPKDHLSLDDRYRGHFNILKGYVEHLDLAGVKVIGDYVDNYRHDLPSEVALLTLYDARTGVPIAMTRSSPSEYVSQRVEPIVSSPTRMSQKYSSRMGRR